MIKYGKHLEGGEHCVFTRTVETRGKGIRTFANLVGKIVKKEFISESEFPKIEQSGWVERENHRTVEVGFSNGGKTAFSVMKKARVNLV